MEYILWKNSVISPRFRSVQIICHSKELVELSRTTPKSRTGQNYGLRYRSLKSKKEKRGVSSFLGVKNSNIQMIVHSKELFELSRMIPKSTRFDDFRQSYDQKLIMVRTHFWVIHSWGQHYCCLGDVLYLSLKVGKPNSLQLVPAKS